MNTKEKDKAKVEELRKTNAIKSMYYTRYFMVRYVVTFFVFANLYWGILLYLSKASATVVAPVLLGLFAALAMWEQYRMFTIEQKEAKFSKAFFKTTIAVNSCLAIMTLAGQSASLYPFFNTSFASKMVILSLLAAGALLAFWMLVKINRIDTNKDKQYVRINRYLESLNLSKHY
ncbi:hypothetical protein A9Q68_04465 [Streptococcus bovimastitidis]|uniref:PTS cellobiose transporter subunit IIA n=1 Tax=Streptococcus bovimastitidis TaxID=1856638 RepID=A0A1L8MQ42_9STRE|nr:hypothetical protein [Streptococcus bovimastitidis]OJF72805.1 hypothetical protein A9Q68_04465 [Streptococcus bovimastitidis]